MQRNPVTPKGYAALVCDLKHHKSTLRPQVVRDIETARAHGDLSENAEYDGAKEEQSLIEGRIAFLEQMVGAADIIDVRKLTPSDRVVFGTTVHLEHVETGEERTWTIVGETESDVERGLISFKTPVARAMIGRTVGDEITVPAPAGAQVWEIAGVEYGT